jgi:diaminohydroxyphosphoribosylaminopyrimidine deaminase/5-amino-6-(5-phosphoribosylamino)uracil reductase
VPTWFLVLRGVDAPRRDAFLAAGVEVIEVPATSVGELDLTAALRELGRRGLTRVLVEGGAILVALLLRAGLVDRLAWFRAPKLIGGDGMPAVAALGIPSLDLTPRFARTSLEAVGEDVLETLRRSP